VAAVTVSDVCVSVSALLKKNGLSYPHQSWYTYTIWQWLSMHWPGDQPVKGQGRAVMKISRSIGC